MAERHCAELVDGSVVRGESTISRNKPPIKRVFLEPENPVGYEPALGAIIHADLIVLGTHGRHGLGLLLGSTASGVLHGCPCDVLTVRIK